jgi:hypothetical protein
LSASHGASRIRRASMTRGAKEIPMPGLEVVLPLALFFTMAVVVVGLVWRLIAVGGEVRMAEQYRQAAIQTARAASACLADLADLVDAVRRRKADPESARGPLEATSEETDRHLAEARALARNNSLGEPAVGLVAEIERASRAMELIGHGLDMLTEDRGSHLGEGETDVKRGYIGLLHAREGIEALGHELASGAEAGRRRSWRWR